jgi:hypothetical protein
MFVPACRFSTAHNCQRNKNGWPRPDIRLRSTRSPYRQRRPNRVSGTRCDQRRDGRPLSLREPPKRFGALSIQSARPESNQMPERSFPPPWSVEEHAAYFVVRDHNGRALAYIYYENKPGRRWAGKLLTNENRQAARVAAEALVRWRGRQAARLRPRIGAAI